MNIQRIEQLYAKCLAGSASERERQEVLAWLALPENERLSKDWLLYGILNNNKELSFNEQKADSMMQAIFNADRQQPKIVSALKYRWIAYAAAVVLLICGAAYSWFLMPADPIVNLSIAENHSDILPGHQGAVLTLNDGRKIILDSVAEGTVDLQENVQAVLQDGALTYHSPQSYISGFNTISTPRGRKFDIKLNDGTHVWLNAASSVTFPIVFNENNRSIKITGEVYIEVAKNKKPFFVNVEDKSTVQALGTSFNIKAYPDEPGIQTTLLTGAVKITGQQEEKILRPGQQSNLSAQGVMALNDNVSIEQVMAWKNGAFNFNKADIRTVMRQLARWYDIEVIYSGNITKREFKGEIGSDLSLSQVLKGLQNMEVHFEINGRRVTVMP